MLGELLHPGVGDEDGVLVGVVLRDLEALVVGVLDDLNKVVTLEGECPAMGRRRGKTPDNLSGKRTSVGHGKSGVAVTTDGERA